MINSKHRIAVSHFKQDEICRLARLQLVSDRPMIHNDSVVGLCHQLKARVTLTAQ